MNEKACRHFNGGLNEACELGIVYPRPLPHQCWGHEDRAGSCDKFEPHTKEDIEKHNAEVQHHIDCMKKGLSFCCQAEIDSSHVITSGRHKGHGPRFCSKCKKLIFMV